jgi:hypothetical protein
MKTNRRSFLAMLGLAPLAARAKLDFTLPAQTLPAPTTPEPVVPYGPVNFIGSTEFMEIRDMRGEIVAIIIPDRPTPFSLPPA